jgi:hypothetical protein
MLSRQQHMRRKEQKDMSHKNGVGVIATKKALGVTAVAQIRKAASVASSSSSDSNDDDPPAKLPATLSLASSPTSSTSSSSLPPIECICQVASTAWTARELPRTGQRRFNTESSSSSDSDDDAPLKYAPRPVAAVGKPQPGVNNQDDQL